jgi:hypothetical protein
LTQSAPHTLATVCRTHFAHAAAVLSISPMMRARSARLEVAERDASLAATMAAQTAVPRDRSWAVAKDVGMAPL